MMVEVEGLQLFEVRVEYDSDFGYRKSISLWITSERRMLSEGARKAKSFLRKQRGRFPHGKIISVTDRGTIDA